jgi:GAF domain-containing protein
MSSRAVHVLQQEIARLKKENETRQTEIESLKRCIASLTELYWAIQWIESAKNLESVIDLRLKDMMQAMDADDGSLLLLDEQTDELVFEFVHGSAAERLAGHRIAKDVGVAGWVMQNGEPAIVNNPKQDWRFSASIDQEFAFLTRSMLCVPMMRNARPIGVIEMLNKKQRAFTELDAILALVLGQFVTAALDQIAARTSG